MIDLMVHNGTVLDGTGSPGRRADLLVSDGRIAEIAPSVEMRSGTALDASGCVVCPGFVDMHSHADSFLQILPTADNLVQQGITTAVTGQCGGSVVPLLEETREDVLAARTSKVAALPWERLSSFGSYLDLLRETGISVNVVPLVGQSTVRSAVMGFSGKAPTRAQLARMRELISEAMDQGAIGLSTGLIYPPGSYASTEEIIALTRPVGERGGYYFSHVRGEADRLIEAVREALRIGRETGASVEISHFKAAGRPNWAKADAALDQIEAAQAEGLDVTADMYPYLAGSSSLRSMLPEWAQEGGVQAVLARLADPATRRRMSDSMCDIGFFRGAEWAHVMIADSPRDRALEGRTVAALAKSTGKSAHDWVFDALLATELEIQMITDYACEENLERQLRRPWMMIGTDAGLRSTNGPLSLGLPHPRHYGAFPRVLGCYVRERGIIPLEEAIHRMTGLPARKLGWQDRGLLKEGYQADLVILDPDQVSDTATYQAPHQYPRGIRHVVVNGEIVVRDGQHTGARPGRILGIGKS